MRNRRGRDGLCQAEPSVTNSERSKLVENPASSRKRHRSWPDERLRIANRASCAERTSCNQERGASAPRGMYSECELETRKSSALRLQPWFPTSGGLTLVPGRKRPQLQLRYAHARRAHARRSWLCIRQSPNITRLSPDGVLIPVPQRADEGRSWFGRCCGELLGLRPVWS